MAGRFLTLAMLLAAVLVASIMVGAVPVPAAGVYKAITNPDPGLHTTLVREIRMPRAVAGALVGAALAVAGAVMQAATRNPLAAPGVAGVSAGATLVVIILTVLKLGSGASLAAGAFLGAAAGGALVFAMAAGRGATPVLLALAGVAVSALREASVAIIISWSTGGLDSRLWSHVNFLWPWVAVGLVGALILAPRLDLMQLGDEVAVGLGLNLTRARFASLLVVVVLAGSAVAAAGPIGFVGLIVPHIVRRLFGRTHRLLLPACALGGALLLTAADIGARLVMRPVEVPVGIIMAALGGPFFLWLVRREAA